MKWLPYHHEVESYKAKRPDGLFCMVWKSIEGWNWRVYQPGLNLARGTEQYIYEAKAKCEEFQCDSLPSTPKPLDLTTPSVKSSNLE